VPGPRGVGRGLSQIDGLRGLAVAEVVVFHAAGRLIPSGYIGVDVFLVLSGFLITGILLREYERTSTIRMRRFYARRALRILPALVVVCVVMIGCALILPDLRDREASLLGAVGALTYTASPLAAAGRDLGDFLPTWSLSVQEYFYVLWPLIMLLVLRRTGRRTVVLITVLTGVAGAYTMSAYLLFHWSEERISYAADTRLVQLLVGVLFAVLISRTRIAVPTWLAAGCAVVLVGCVTLPVSVSTPFYYGGASLLVALLAALLVVHLAAGRSVLARVLSWGPMVWVGRRSYGIYLWSLPVGALVSLTLMPGLPRFAARVVLTVLVPAVSYTVVEQPMLRLRRHLDGAATQAITVPRPPPLRDPPPSADAWATTPSRSVSHGRSGEG
jgi:peptidoglycan/LPS O-acetylase OafA/YrhL